MLNWFLSPGSADDKRTMTRAEEYGCERDHSELSDAQLSVTITAEQVTHLSAHLFFSTYIHPSVSSYLCLHPSLHLSIHPSTHKCIHSSIRHSLLSWNKNDGHRINISHQLLV